MKEPHFGGRPLSQLSVSDLRLFMSPDIPFEYDYPGCSWDDPDVALRYAAILLRERGQ